MDKTKLLKNRVIDKVAPGLDAEDALDEEATTEEVAEGDSTKVTQLVYDEYDPSSES